MADKQTTLIEKGSFITRDDEGDIYQPVILQVRGNQIATLGPGAVPIELLSTSKTTLNASNIIILPGMVKTHFHLFRAFIRGMTGDKPLLD